MSFIVRVIVLATLVSASVAGPAIADPFTLASSYGVVSFGDMVVSNTEVNGRIAVGGNATFQNFNIGKSLSPDASRLDLVVGGTATLKNGQIASGSGIAHDASLTGVGLKTNGATFQTGASPLDFAGMFGELADYSDSLSLQTANGAVDALYGALILTGSDPLLNVFSIDASDMADKWGVKLFAPAGSTVLINVLGQGPALGYGVDFRLNDFGGSNEQEAAIWSRVLWNFADATSLSSHSTWKGSVLAPNADVRFDSAAVLGQLVVGSLNTQSAIYHVQFDGILPSTAPDPAPVPEPASLTLLGLGLTGLGMFRRRRKR